MTRGRRKEGRRQIESEKEKNIGREEKNKLGENGQKGKVSNERS